MPYEAGAEEFPKKLSAMKTLDRILLILLSSLVFFVTSCDKPVKKEVEPKNFPNVIILVVDALRQSHLGCYGHSLDTSPQLDTYSAKGIRFQNAFCHSSHTKISTASLFSGLIPPSHGVRNAGNWKEELKGRVTSDVLSSELFTIAELFEENGYNTYGIITNPHITTKSGFAQGFKLYRYLPGLTLGTWASADTVNQTAMDLLSKDREKPFFLYLHYLDVHEPYKPLPQYLELFTLGIPKTQIISLNGPYAGKVSKDTVIYTERIYDAQIKYWDDQFKSFITALKDQGYLKNTIVIITADHGEEFYDHGGFGHGYTCFDEMLRVPLVTVWQNKIPEGLVVKDMVQQIDIYPSLAFLAGLDTKKITLQGRNIFSRSRDGKILYAPPARSKLPLLYTETYRGRVPRCLRTDNLKVIYNLRDNSLGVFRLDIDPLEQKNIYSLETSRLPEVATVVKKLKQIMNSPPLTKSPTPTIELDENTVKALKSLGYLGD